jgi:ketosteroid isomerase-like protein
MADSDFEKIVRLLTEYARAVDTRDWARYETVFAPEAVIDYTPSGGIRGSRAEATAWVSNAMEMFSMSQHMVMNHDIVVDGDTATSHSDYYNPLGRPDGSGGQALLFVGGAYIDKLRRDGDGWLITERFEDMKWWTGDWPDGVTLD